MAICTKADLRRDNIESAGGWGLLVGPDHVSLHFPVTDDGRGRWIEIPRADFDLLAGWYVAAHTPHVLRPTPGRALLSTPAPAGTPGDEG